MLPGMYGLVRQHEYSVEFVWPDMIPLTTQGFPETTFLPVTNGKGQVQELRGGQALG